MNRLLLSIIILTTSIVILRATPQELLNTDFGAATQAVHEVSGAMRITGKLPTDWHDNSGWNPEIQLDYQPLTEEAHSFLRISKSGMNGRGQVAAMLPAPLKECFLRLEFTARSRKHTVLEAGVRLVGAPYSFCWETHPRLGDDWQTYRYTFHLAAPPQPVGVWLNINSAGEIDLRDLRLRKYSYSDLLAEMKAAHPGADSGNLLRNSRLPLGLQSGWSIDREVSDGDVVTVAADQAVIGPSGAAATCIASPLPAAIYSAPFSVPCTYLPHTASLYLRGNASGKLVVLGEWHALSSQPFSVNGAEWQRVSVTFTPDLLGTLHTLRLESTGRLWIDALQVEGGSSARPYAAPGDAEVALALPPSDAAAARVQFDDEPPIIDYCVTGKTNGAVLKAAVVNVYGQRVALPPVPLGADFRHDGTLRYDVFPARPYGPFRLEAWVENEHGERIGPPNELVVNRLRRPRYWGKDALDSPFGVHTNANTRHLLLAKAIGANWVRLHDAGTQYIGWVYLEPKQGEWHFHDADINRYRANHLKILGMLSTAPGWATNLKHPANNYFERYLMPLKLTDFAAYVRTVTTRYKGIIDSYEVWNEPYGASFLNQDYDEHKGTTEEEHCIRGKTPEADYANLMKTAFTAAKSVDKSICLLGFNTAGGAVGASWTKAILDQGGLASCDAISYHHYSADFNGSPDDSAAQAFSAATGPLRDAHDVLPKPVWMSEGDSYDNEVKYGMYHYTVLENLEDDNIGAANRLCRYLLAHRALGEAHTFIYSMHCQDYFHAHSDKWCALVTQDGYPHPSADAHSAFAWLLEDTRFRKCQQLAAGVYAYFFAGAGRTVAVLSAEAEHAPFIVPQAKGISVTDLFGNAVTQPAPLDENLVFLTTTNGVDRLAEALTMVHAKTQRRKD